MIQQKRIVITGIGVVSPIGNSIQEYWDSLLNGVGGASMITHFDPSELETRFACQVKNFNVNDFIDIKSSNRMDRYAHFGVISAEMALKDSCLKLEEIDPLRIGVIFGSGIGGMQTYHNQFKRYFESGPSRISPFLIPMFIPDMAAGLISIRNKLMGPNYATVSACSSSLHAIMDAWMVLSLGLADYMVCGGSDATVTPMAIAGFNNAKAMSTRNENFETASRPYDIDRDGFVMGEGGGALVLETIDSAKARGAKIYAELCGVGASADAYHMTAPHPDGMGAIAAMKSALSLAGLSVQDIDYINTHGTSTPLGDVAEVKAIKKVFGSYTQSINLSSTKSMTGHLLGAAGAVETIACILAIERQVIPPTINLFRQDPEIDVNITPNKVTQDLASTGYNINKKVRSFVVSEIGYNPRNVEHFVIAFTHRSALESSSFVKQKPKNLDNYLEAFKKSNERLEFLGDAVLDLIVADFLYKKFPDYEEGNLTKLRSSIVNTSSVAKYSKSLKLCEELIVGEGLDRKVLAKSDFVLADLFEAVLGAVYLDAGYEFAKQFVENKILYHQNLNQLVEEDKNFKSALLEVSQYYRLNMPSYLVLEENGPSHNKEFVVGVKIKDKIIGIGRGRTKKDAEQQAAKYAIQKIKPNVGYTLPKLSDEENEVTLNLPENLQRKKHARLPEMSENYIMRHFVKLSTMNYHIDKGMYPLGSCTMKYNPKSCEAAAAQDGFLNLHPLQDEQDIQGALHLMYDLSKYLAEITGLDEVTLQPLAGAHGELLGIFMIRSYHEKKYGTAKKTILTVDSSHGTNPASAVMGGYQIVTVKSDNAGLTDMSDLKSKLSHDVAAFMITNPNTLGIFERNIIALKQELEKFDVLLYMDGANMNALLALCRPGDMGVDVLHLNLHKSFSTPHGGGGPGAGPVGVSKRLSEFLPDPKIVQNLAAGKPVYSLKLNPNSIGQMCAFMGNFAVLVRAYAYILQNGQEGLYLNTQSAIINANYLHHLITKEFESPFKGPYMHEFCLSGAKQKQFGVKTIDVAKRVLDYGFHAPTIYFPLIVNECLMIEPTETESKETLEDFALCLNSIASEAANNPDIVRSAPNTTPHKRLSDTHAVKNINVSFNFNSLTEMN
ncbi:hypothetical protein CHS0354_023808 [Potamilus streckersoni]|uniref:Glycine cleavage system P protein n=1 Tax=Potamilus streckersoni TaxID=2493646 RepID=A0AAE0VLG8_9BIVA|nr:hypothetical protein CHS0354_023808 [Potamilus streckersoni]